jgi:hypothetical protein
LVQGFNSRYAAFKRCYAAFKDLTAFDLQSRICGFQWVISFLNTAKQCWNAERSEAIERHEVPLELLNAATRLSSTSLRSVFKRCYAAFKDLTAFDLQSRICGFQ